MHINEVYMYRIIFKSGERFINKVVIFLENYSNKEIEAIISTKFIKVTSVESITEIEKGFYVNKGESGI